MSSRISAPILLALCLLLTVSGVAIGIDVQFYETPLAEALNELSLITGVNIIRPENITGSVTAQFSGASLAEILSSLLAPTDYAFQIVDDSLAIVSARNPKDPAFPVLAETRVYRVRPTEVNQVVQQLGQYKNYIKANHERGLITVTALPEDLKLIDQAVTAALRTVHQDTITYQFTFTRISAEKAKGFGLEIAPDNEEQPKVFTINFPLTQMPATFSERADYRSVISTAPYKRAHLSLVMAELPVSPSRVLLELLPLQVGADSILTAVSFSTDPAEGRKEAVETIVDLRVGESKPLAIIRVGSERVHRSLLGFRRSQAADYYVFSLKADVAADITEGSLQIAGSFDGFDQLFFIPQRGKAEEQEGTVIAFRKNLADEGWGLTLQTDVMPRVQVGFAVSDEESAFVDLGWRAVGDLFVISRLYTADPNKPGLNLGFREKSRLFGNLYLSAQFLPIRIGQATVRYDATFLDCGISYEGKRLSVGLARNYRDQQRHYDELTVSLSLSESFGVFTAVQHTESEKPVVSFGFTLRF
ncbi:MAG: hypothetical protein GX058_04470 [Firmicutes bacterium]|nr:hypothetical protein [Bacillota bacterium]